jgi:hypothetical protein
MSEANRQKAIDPQWLQKVRHANQQKASDFNWQTKHREAMRKLPQDAEWRQKHREAMQKLTDDPEWREKINEAAQAVRLRGPRHGKYKGVYAKCNRFTARIQYKENLLYLGSHPTAEQAARVYDAVARILYNGLCYVNFPYEPNWLLAPQTPA